SPKSALGEKYDFYYDCVLRHAESTRAIVAIDENGFVENWSYKKLHRVVNSQVKQWTKNGVKAGEFAVMILPLGLPFFVALLTALRLGLKICYLPPETPYLSLSHISCLISQLKPHWLITSKQGLPSSLDS